MSFQTAFFTNANVQSMASYVSRSTKIPMSVILAQMADETFYGTSYAWDNLKNPAGIGGSDNGFAYYSTYTDAAVAYANFYLDNSNYAHVLAVARSGGTPDQVAVAIGQSPWASSHYDATVCPKGCDYMPPNPGIDLINIIEEYNLTKYDTSVQLSTDTAYVPTCSGIGNYMGTGKAVDVETGLFLFQEDIGDITINTVVNSQCQQKARYIHAPATTAANSALAIAAFATVGIAGYFAYKHYKGTK
ncbi:MAG: glucosaminidase domain-containing protein [Acidibacillus sp.]|nr:glucosaminidase domain-containing protein [Acidibacillus sp.]